MRAELYFFWDSGGRVEAMVGYLSQVGVNKLCIKISFPVVISVFLDPFDLNILVRSEGLNFWNFKNGFSCFSWHGVQLTTMQTTLRRQYTQDGVVGNGTHLFVGRNVNFWTRAWDQMMLSVRNIEEKFSRPNLDWTVQVQPDWIRKQK